MEKTKEVQVPTTIDIDLTGWSVALKERTRDRMKLQIKLNKIEAQAFKNFAEVVKPDEISSEDFLKSIFKIGLEEMETRLMSAVEKHAEENNIDMASLKKDSGIEEGAGSTSKPMQQVASTTEENDEANDEE